VTAAADALGLAAIDSPGVAVAAAGVAVGAGVSVAVAALLHAAAVMSTAMVRAPTRPARAMWITVASPQTWGVGRILESCCAGRASRGAVNSALPARIPSLTSRSLMEDESR